MNSDIETLDKALQAAGYIADPALTTTLHLADRLQRPVLLEGEAGVGKTAVAKALAQSRDTELVRLQLIKTSTSMVIKSTTPCLMRAAGMVFYFLSNPEIWALLPGLWSLQKSTVFFSPVR